MLRRGVVGIGGVGEGTRLHSSRVHDNGERGVWLDVTTIRWELKFNGRHVVDTGNIAHRRRVARASLNLLAVCDGLANAEANEVVCADEGVRFAGCLTLTVDGLNDGRVQSKGGLRVAISPVVVVVATGLGIVATRRIVITTTVAVATKPIVLTGYETIRLWNEEGNGELGNDKENERDLKALHGSCTDGWKGKSEVLAGKK